MKELVQIAREAKRPPQVADHPGTSWSLALEGLKKAAGVGFESVYYKGAPSALSDLVNGLLAGSF